MIEVEIRLNLGAALLMDQEPESQPAEPAAPPIQHRRNWRLPLLLFIATIISTFWSGAAGFASFALVFEHELVGPILVEHWREGLVYMASVLAILGAHEMGHFLLAVRHRIPASWPFFIPMPILPFGTMGAVIAMQGYKANRTQLFDIGIAGPLAGLLVAIPITIAGILQADLAPVHMKGHEFHDPVIVEFLIYWLRPDAQGRELLLNPMLTAGWVGFLITGLNMMPVSQLDGGHISYALLGRRAHLIARLTVLAAIVFMVWMQVAAWALMLVLVLVMGVDHPPTANDQAPLGRLRTALGWASLSIPILCFPVMGITEISG